MFKLKVLLLENSIVHVYILIQGSCYLNLFFRKKKISIGTVFTMMNRQ